MSIPKILLAGGLLGLAAVALKPVFASRSSIPDEPIAPPQPQSDKLEKATSGILTPEDFASQARSLGIFEIQSSQLALTKAQNDEVRRFAQAMIDDHTKANEALDQIILDEAFWLPADEFDDRHEGQFEALKHCSLQDFDQQFIALQVEAHDEAVALFERFSSYGADGPVKAYAVDTLPRLKQHLEHVRGLTNLPSPVLV